MNFNSVTNNPKQTELNETKWNSGNELISQFRNGFYLLIPEWKLMIIAGWIMVPDESLLPTISLLVT